MTEFHGIDFDELFASVVRKIDVDPRYVCRPRGQTVREIIAPTLVLRNPRARLLANPARDVNYGFGVGEFLWYWGGRRDLASILYYNKRMKDFSDDNIKEIGEPTLNSAYGYRLRKPMDPPETIYRVASIKLMSGMAVPEVPFKKYSQWELCKKELLRDHDSRRALLLINEPRDQFVAATVGSNDVPCTLSLQFFIRNDRLILHSHMRSNDAFWGLTYDLFSFTLFQECMLNELRSEGMGRLHLGEYIHTAGSLHIYERHFEMARRVSDGYFNKEFHAAAPMEPIDSSELSDLLEYEEALRTRRVEPDGSGRFSGGIRWMAEQLEAHRRKRDAE